ncbi:MAG: 2-C-methyl-D-erythritol 4-phosphate cytidylyltransferase [Patulibacter sp.]
MGGRTQIGSSTVARASALIVAAGRGTRLGSALPKAFVDLAGEPMVAWSIRALQAAGVQEIVLALPPDGELPQRFIAHERDGGARRDAARLVLPDAVRTVRGGAERSHSVRAALAASSGDPVIVHDAARPLLTPEFVAAALDRFDRSVRGNATLCSAARPTEAGADATPLAAAVIAAPVVDTIKRSVDGQHVSETLPRSELWAVQTPQVFCRAWLERALDQPDEALATATDDASLVEALGGTVALVPAPGPNLKVTTPHDRTVAELLLAARPD